ncbi:MAG: molybdopterin-dependent oxidoreductase [Nakamurella sp.]
MVAPPILRRILDPAGSEHYHPVSWDAAFEVIAGELAELDSPDQATVYTSGRTSNEAAYAYQLFVPGLRHQQPARLLQHVPRIDRACHVASIGIGKSTISYDDFELADLIIIMGQNPGTNHPRMLTALEEAKRAGASIVAVNPLPEAGLMRFKNPQRPSGVVGRGTQLADQFLQIRMGGDMALMQAVSSRVLQAEEAAPGTVLDHDFIAEHCSRLAELAEHLGRWTTTRCWQPPACGWQKSTNWPIVISVLTR